METAQGGTVLGNAIRNPHSVVRTAYTLYGRVDRPRTFAPYAVRERAMRVHHSWSGAVRPSARGRTRSAAARAALKS